MRSILKILKKIAFPCGAFLKFRCFLIKNRALVRSILKIVMKKIALPCGAFLNFRCFFIKNRALVRCILIFLRKSRPRAEHPQNFVASLSQPIKENMCKIMTDSRDDTHTHRHTHTHTHIYIYMYTDAYTRICTRNGHLCDCRWWRCTISTHIYRQIGLFHQRRMQQIDRNKEPGLHSVCTDRPLKFTVS